MGVYYISYLRLINVNQINFYYYVFGWTDFIEISCMQIKVEMLIDKSFFLNYADICCLDQIIIFEYEESLKF